MKPITREEMYLAAAAGYDVTPPEPVTRKEMFLAKLAGMEVETPAVFTRQERFLDEATARAPSVTINNQDITVTENGQYTADEGYTGLGTVTVEVPDEPAVLEDLKVTENGNYKPSDGVDGFGSVYVNVPDIPAVIHPLEITENGTYTAPDGVDGYSPVTVNVPAPEVVLQDKTITENGTYTADSGYDGLGSVTVDVKGGGGLPVGGYLVGDTVPCPVGTYPHKLFKLNGILYALVWPYREDQSTKSYNVYKYTDGSWTKLNSSAYTMRNTGMVGAQFLEFNGKMHILGGTYAYHYVYDEVNGMVQLSDLPTSITNYQAFIDDGKLKAFVGTYGAMVWDESTDTWSTDASAPAWRYGFNYKGDLYWLTSTNEVYIRKDGVDTKLCQNTNILFHVCVKNGHLYDYRVNGNYYELYKTNLETGERTLVIRTTKVAKVEFYTTGDDEPILWRGGHNSDYVNSLCLYILHEVTE